MWCSQPLKTKTRAHSSHRFYLTRDLRCVAHSIRDEDAPYICRFKQVHRGEFTHVATDETFDEAEVPQHPSRQRKKQWWKKGKPLRESHSQLCGVDNPVIEQRLSNDAAASDKKQMPSAAAAGVALGSAPAAAGKAQSSQSLVESAGASAA